MSALVNFDKTIKLISFADSLFNYLDSSASKKDKLNRIINDIDMLIEYKYWHTLQEIWENINLKKYDREIYITLLKRTMSSIRVFHLSNRIWIAISRQKFYKSVEEEFKNRKIRRYKKMLEGLE